jgi:hypothetical protein
MSMKIVPPSCPECGEIAVSILESLLCNASVMTVDENGEQTDIKEKIAGFDYTGDTEMAYDTQEPVLDRNRQATAVCSKYHEWQAKIR